jgi:type IV pilus assembly protein PilA
MEGFSMISNYETRKMFLNKGFTLIELMIVIAIIAVLLSLALPSYQDFTIRSKVTEGLSIASAAKVAVTETCMTDPTINPTNSTQNTCNRPWIVIRTRNTGASTNVVLSLDGYFDISDGSARWHCHRVSGEEQHIPRDCHGPHWTPP